MRLRSRGLLQAGTLAVMISGLALAQACGGSAPEEPAATVEAPGATAPAAEPQAHGTMNQVMQGILFPNSNVIFRAQSEDPAAFKSGADQSTASDPLIGVYGGWQAVENAGIALAESANLLLIPRNCSNGKPAPVDAEDWLRFVQGTRDAGMAAVKAGQAKNQDTVLEVADQLATACANCHDVYREKTPEQGGLDARCTK